MLEKIITIIAEQLHMDPTDISADSLITDELNADSLDIVEILMVLEDTFHMEIPDEDIEGIRTPADIAAYLEAHAG